MLWKLKMHLSYVIARNISVCDTTIGKYTLIVAIILYIIFAWSIQNRILLYGHPFGFWDGLKFEGRSSNSIAERDKVL